MTILCFVSLQYVCEKLLDLYGVKCSVENVLNLDSSTEEKFSRHLIFNLQNAAFKDNIHVGMFADSLKQNKTWCYRRSVLFTGVCGANISIA